MDYNTQLPKLIIPEYGRNIQRMVDFLFTIEDRETRNKQAQALINVMGNLNPHLRDVPDFKHKLWDHLFIMSEFKLDVDSPYDKPSEESLMEKPDKVPYNTERIRYRHLGKVLEKMIEKAQEKEEGELKDLLVYTLTNHMKKSYTNWNRVNIEDEVILEQLSNLSNGKLKLSDNYRLSHFGHMIQPTKNQSKGTGNSGSQRSNTKSGPKGPQKNTGTSGGYKKRR